MVSTGFGTKRILDEVVGKLPKNLLSTATDVVGSVLGEGRCNCRWFALMYQLDFSNIGDKLKNGDLSGVKIRSSYNKIQLQNRKILKFTEDDLSGNSWQARQLKLKPSIFRLTQIHKWNQT
jgi:hypothetical protein